MWHDGTHHRVAIDTSALYPLGTHKGLLEDFTPLTDFDIERQYGTFSAEDACNFGVHVYEGGTVLSIVVDAGSHGTHVAGITAAYHTDDPALNGIAPGIYIGPSLASSSRCLSYLMRLWHVLLRQKIFLAFKRCCYSASASSQRR